MTATECIQAECVAHELACACEEALFVCPLPFTYPLCPLSRTKTSEVKDGHLVRGAAPEHKAATAAPQEQGKVRNKTTAAGKKEEEDTGTKQKRRDSKQKGHMENIRRR